jgi:hypothetical protein
MAANEIEYSGFGNTDYISFNDGGLLNEKYIPHSHLSVSIYRFKSWARIDYTRG